jgi:hypothetical protein
MEWLSEISSWDLYIITRLDTLLKACTVIAGILSAVSVMLLIGSVCAINDLNLSYKDHAKVDKAIAECASIRKYGVRGTVISLFLWLILILTPTTGEAAFILIGPKALSSDLVQKDLPDGVKEVYGLATTYIKGKLDLPKEMK